jgi:mannan polymerase II complex ANP1 subunit
MAKRMSFSVVGLPHYTVWHLYEPSVDDIKHMEEMEAEKKAREEQERKDSENARKVKSQFEDVGGQWEKDKNRMGEARSTKRVGEEVAKKKGEDEDED